MSYPDTPDGQRGVVNGELVLATVNGGTASVTVDLPSTCKALWILTGPIPDPTLTVIGAQSGIIYPAYPLWTQDASGELNLSVVAFVTSEIDVSVTIHWASTPAAAWTVVADNGSRFVLDAALAASAANPGTLAPLYAVQVAGTDGADLRALSVDNTGALKTVGSSFPPVYTPVGAAQPADVLQIGGANGGDLLALVADATGRLFVVDPNVAAAIAAPGATPPASVVLLGGTDGGHVRAVLVDSTGRLSTDDVNVAKVVGLPTAAVPTEAVMAAFTDGVDLRVPITSKSALPYAIPSAPSELTADRPPNEVLYTGLDSQAASINLLNPPGAGKAYRLFFLYAYANQAAANFYIFLALPSGAMIKFCTSLASPGQTVAPAVLPLTGLLVAANTAVALELGGGTAGAIVGYTIETV